jgi:hypothetical protein
VTRVRLIDGCFTPDGLIMSPATVIRGSAALAAAIGAFFVDPRGLSARPMSAIDVQGPIFHFAQWSRTVMAESFSTASTPARLTSTGGSRSCSRSAPFPKATTNSEP